MSEQSDDDVADRKRRPPTPEERDEADRQLMAMREVLRLRERGVRMRKVEVEAANGRVMAVFWREESPGGRSPIVVTLIGDPLAYVEAGARRQV